MDNIQLCYIDNEINKIDKMKQGDVIYKNGVELLVVLSYDHNEPCKGCFFYEDKACGSERLIKCWDCKKEYIFTAIRKYNTTELCGIVKRYEETILKTIKKIEKECQKYVIWDTVHVMLKDDGELIIKALSKDKSVLLNDFIKEDDKKQRSTENRLFKKYACRDWDGRGSTQWKSFPTQSPICRGNDGLPFNVDNLTIPYGKWRKESIKAYGNAIVPLIAVKIFEMINKIEGYEQQTTL